MKYWYCAVAVKGVDRTYSYISDLGAIEPGSYVEVPFGAEDPLYIGRVERCGEFCAEDAPYPVEKTKHIRRLATLEEYEAQLSIEVINELFWIDRSIEEKACGSVLRWALSHEEDEREVFQRKVLECYQLCADQGMPIAALQLGVRYYLGKGVEQSYTKAIELYEYAAKAGELRAICKVGHCYYDGRHGTADYEKAYRYFSLGALAHSDPNCIYKLGDMYGSGHYVEKNETYAYMLYRKAMREAKKHQDRDVLPDIHCRLGKCKLYGIGTVQKADQAYLHLQKALIGFHRRRKKDPFADALIKEVKQQIREAERLLEQGML